MSAFDEFRLKAWPHRFTGELKVAQMMGGIPTDPKVAEGWIKSKMGLDDAAQIQALVAETMLTRKISMEEAVEAVNTNRHLNGFKRNADNVLYYETRCLKSAIKEACSIAADTNKIAARGFGNNTRKGIISFVAEHVFVLGDEISLGVTEPTGVLQKFVHTFRGSGIQYEEYVTDATLTFSVVTDHPFSDEDWAMIWLTMEQEGIGASRSQGYGRFQMQRWERQTPLVTKKTAAKK